MPFEKTLILRNGIGKPFEKYLNIPTNKISNSMTYCSIPWRGLELLIPIFKKIKETTRNLLIKSPFEIKCDYNDTKKNNSCTKLVENSSDPSSEDYLSISTSWELGFSNYNLILLDNNEKNIASAEVISDPDQVEKYNLTKQNNHK
mgnify:CR=1 FL=1